MKINLISEFIDNSVQESFMDAGQAEGTKILTPPLIQRGGE